MEAGISGDSAPAHRSEIAGDVRARSRSPARPARGRRFPVWLIASQSGLWARQFVDAHLHHREELMVQQWHGAMQVVGLLWVSATLQHPDYELPDLDDSSVLLTHASKETRFAVQGMVVYEVLQRHPFATAVEFESLGKLELWQKLWDLHLPQAEQPAHGVVAQWCGRSSVHPEPYHACTKLGIRIIRHGWRCCHAVAVTGRVKRSRLIGNFPSQDTLHTFRISIPAAARSDEEQGRVGKHTYGGLPADVVIPWIDATAYLKDLKQCREAAVAWSKVLALHGRHQIDETNLHLEATREQVRRARVRLDMSCMVLWRLTSMQLESPSWYLWTDSSPQWRGRGVLRKFVRLLVGRPIPSQAAAKCVLVHGQDICGP